MDTMLAKNALIAFGAMFTAVVMGFFAFMNLIASKEQKVSEFRQQWIDSLRDSIASYISSLSYLSVLYKNISKRNPQKEIDKFEMVKGVEDIYLRVNESYNDILFRINPDEKDSAARAVNLEFLSAIEKSRQLYLKGKYVEAVVSCEEIRKATKPLLKFEWNRVRRGEFSYRLSKYASVLVLASGIILASYNAYYIYDGSGFQVEPASVPRDEKHISSNRDVASQDNQPPLKEKKQNE